MRDPKYLPSKLAVCEPTIKVLGELARFRPGVGVSLKDVVQGVIAELRCQSPNNPPYEVYRDKSGNMVPLRVSGGRPNLTRFVYLALWNFAVERREGKFWTVRMDADRNREFRLSTKELSGKSRVGDKKPKKKDNKKGFLWGLTWYGLRASFEFHYAEQNITSVFFDTRTKASDGRKYLEKVLNTVRSKCRMSATMSLEEDHAQHYYVNALWRDTLRNQLVKNFGYGGSLGASVVGGWIAKSARSEWRGEATDAAMRTLRGSTTETERKKAKEQEKLLAEQQERGEDGIPAFPMASAQISSGGALVSPVVIDQDEPTQAINKEFVDTSGVSPDERFQFEAAMQEMELILADHFPGKVNEYAKVMYHIMDGTSVTDVASLMDIPLKQARDMQNEVRAAIWEDRDLLLDNSLVG